MLKKLILLALFIVLYTIVNAQNTTVVNAVKHSGVAYVQSASDASIEVFTVMASFKVVEQGGMTFQNGK